jgi:hypothetical protein
MTRDEQVNAQLEKYTLNPDPKFAEEIREIIRQEIANEKREDNEILNLSCMQLFSLGEAKDSLLIYKAKMSSFDASLYLDIQLLCGAGLEETKDFLAKQNTPETKEVLDHLLICEKGGEFDEFSVESQTKWHHQYFYGS